MKNCKDCIWYGKEKPDQCGNYLCRNQSEYDPRFGISPTRICLIVNGMSWKHVEEDG